MWSTCIKELLLVYIAHLQFFWRFFFKFCLFVVSFFLIWQKPRSYGQVVFVKYMSCMSFIRSFPVFYVLSILHGTSEYYVLSTAYLYRIISFPYAPTMHGVYRIFSRWEG